MVSASKIDGGGSQLISPSVRTMIQSIREIVGNHSDIDIYRSLKENDMDPNETTQKLLHQDPFHEVKRRRDKKKEVLPNSIGQKVPTEPRRHIESAGEGPRSKTTSERVVEPKRHFETALQGPKPKALYDRNVEPRRQFDSAGQGPKYDKFSDRNVEPRRQFDSAGQGPKYDKFSHWNVEIRRHFENAGQGPKQGSFSDRNVRGGSYARRGFFGITKEFRVVRDNRASHNTDGENKPASPQCTTSANEQVTSNVSEKRPSQALNEQTDSRIKTRDGISTVPIRKDTSVDKRVAHPNSASRVQAERPNNSRTHSASSTSVIGVYSSSTDPVHVPSPDSRPSASVGAIKREVGVRKQSSDNSKSVVSSSSDSFSGDKGSAESFRSVIGITKPDHLDQTSDSVIPSVPVSRTFISNHQNVRPRPQPVGHQKASQPNKEWKPKASQKSSSNSLGSHWNTNKICFSSFLGTESDNGFQTGPTEESNRESPAGFSTSAPESYSDEASTKPIDLLDDQVRNSGSDFSTPSAVPEKRETSSPQNFDTYADIGLVRDNNPSFTPSELQNQDPPELQGFTAYDPQTVYDIPYYRPNTDVSVHGQELPSPQEMFTSHNANSIPASTVSMVQQQPQHLEQMYPQVHVSHYANMMPFRQYISPVYAPPMAVPSYSNNPAYPHMSNGNNFLLMPGGASHLNPNSLKYGVQQFKPIPAGSPTGFGNYTNPAGYAMSAAPSLAGGAAGLDDSSRMKYKDGNLYVPNQQAETSEIWIQNPRDHPGMQSTPYYSMPGQTPHAAYMPSHAGHASFSAAPQSSHMQYPGMYHPTQPAAMANPHHMGPAMPGNVGVGVAAAAPGGHAYQQPQLNHMNWTPNF